VEVGRRVEGNPGHPRKAAKEKHHPPAWSWSSPWPSWCPPRLRTYGPEEAAVPAIVAHPASTPAPSSTAISRRVASMSHPASPDDAWLRRVGLSPNVSASSIPPGRHSGRGGARSYRQDAALRADEPPLVVTGRLVFGATEVSAVRSGLYVGGASMSTARGQHAPALPRATLLAPPVGRLKRKKTGGGDPPTARPPGWISSLRFESVCSSTAGP
jgi:hypothetical protein